MRRLFTILILSLSGMAAFGQSGEVKKFANEAEVPRITVAEAKKGFDEGTVIFVDARTEVTYKEEHIKSALHISGSDESISSLPKGKRIIVYCSWTAEHTSARLAFQMNQKGIANVFALKGGFQDWKAAKLPTESSK